ncbi:uncharacterized protein TNCV_360541 [Trichonephila clavipes]|nr:uncharacterized protein TNCV_360541 [Trichonephila clavipes]
MLFSLYVAGIEKIIPGESDIGMFADDITLWCSSPDQEFTRNRPIQNLVNKCRKRLNILKFISGREWGADAQTLRTTDIALIRPILDSMPKLWRWRSVVSPSIVPELIRTVTCMVLKAKSNDMRTSSPLPR